MTWTRIDNWEHLADSTPAFELDTPMKCNVMVMNARSYPSMNGTSPNLYTARIYVIPKNNLSDDDDDVDIYDIDLSVPVQGNNFILNVQRHTGLDSHGTGTSELVLDDTYPKSVYSKQLKSPQKFIQFVVTELLETKNKTALYGDAL